MEGQKRRQGLVTRLGQLSRQVGQSSGDKRGVINQELTRRRISGLSSLQNLQDVGRLDVRETEGLSWIGFPRSQPRGKDSSANS